MAPLNTPRPTPTDTPHQLDETKAETPSSSNWPTFALVASSLRRLPSRLFVSVQAAGSVAADAAVNSAQVAGAAVVDTALVSAQVAGSAIASTQSVGSLVANTVISSAQAVGSATVTGVQTAGSMAIDGISSAVTTTAQGTLDASSWLYQGTLSVSQYGATAVGEGFETLLLNTGTLLRQAGTTVDYSLDQLAGDPTQPQTIHMRGLRMAVGLLPIVGNTQGIAQARIKYRNAQGLDDATEKERLMHEARRDCLVVSAALSLEVATLGASGHLDRALKVGGTMLSVLNAGKTAREQSATNSWIPKIDLDVVSPRADFALQFQPLRETMDIILRFDPKQGSQTAHPAESTGGDTPEA